MKIDDDIMLTQPDERTRFCWNCFYFDKKQEDSPCKGCFGNKPNGEYFCYKNGKEGIDNA